MSSSIFDLKTSVNELSSANQGTSSLNYQQVVPSRDVTGNAFSNGSIMIPFQVSGERWWIPSRSYLRLRCQLTRGDGSQFQVVDNIAPAMNLMANLFQSCEIRINDKVVSRIPNYVAQIEALETRLSKSQAQMDGVMGATNFMQSDFSIRQAQICSDGAVGGNAAKDVDSLIGLSDPITPFAAFVATNTVAYAIATGIVTFATGAVPDVRNIFKAGDEIQFSGANAATRLTVLSTPTNLTVQCIASVGRADIAATVLNSVDISATRIRSATNDARNVSDFELTWTPNLSLFKIQHALPSGKYTLVLNPFPQSVYQLQAIESRNQSGAFLSSLPNPTVLGAANQVRFNVIDMFFYCNQVDGPRADNMSFLLDLNQTTCQQENLKVTSFTQKNFDISPSTYALSLAYQDGRCNTDPRVPASMFKCYDATFNPGKELSLNRFYINFAAQSRPNPDADPSFNTRVDRTVQRYIESQIENGSYFDSGGCETLSDFHKRGSYYYFRWARDGTDRSTRASVYSGFEPTTMGTGVDNANVLLFCHSKQIAKITIQDGMVTGVDVEEA